MSVWRLPLLTKIIQKGFVWNARCECMYTNQCVVLCVYLSVSLSLLATTLHLLSGECEDLLSLGHDWGRATLRRLLSLGWTSFLGNCKTTLTWELEWRLVLPCVCVFCGCLLQRAICIELHFDLDILKLVRAGLFGFLKFSCLDSHRWLTFQRVQDRGQTLLGNCRHLERANWCVFSKRRLHCSARGWHKLLLSVQNWSFWLLSHWHKLDNSLVELALRSTGEVARAWLVLVTSLIVTARFPRV